MKKEAKQLIGADKNEKAPSWYKRFQSSDYLTLFHLPFSIVVLDFVILGALASSQFYFSRLILTAIGIFFAHQGSHYLDEIKGHHWNTKLSNKTLYVFSGIFLSIAVSIAVYLSITVSLLLLAFVIPLVFFPVAYSLELCKGKFHNPSAFGISCALIFLGSFFVQSLTLTAFSLLFSIAVGIQGVYIIILYEATKEKQTRAITWNALKGIILIWSFIALAVIIAKIL